MPDETKSSDLGYQSAAEVYGVKRDQPPATPGLSLSPGLRSVEDSKVPGTDRSHVIGPQQAAADPVLAGLDTQHNPMTRAEDRVITRTVDGAMLVPPPDAESDKIVGPSGTSVPAADTAPAEAARVTPTAALVGTQPSGETTTDTI